MTGNVRLVRLRWHNEQRQSKQKKCFKDDQVLIYLKAGPVGMKVSKTKGAWLALMTEAWTLVLV